MQATSLELQVCLKKMLTLETSLWNSFSTQPYSFFNGLVIITNTNLNEVHIDILQVQLRPGTAYVALE